MNGDRHSWFRRLLWQLISRALAELAKLDGPKVRFSYSIGPVENKITNNNMQITINSLQKIKVHLNPVDDETPPEPAPLYGVPVWTVTDGDATLAVDPDGLAAWLISGAPNVTSHVDVTAQGDPTPGVDVIHGTVELVVIHPEATDLGFTADPAVPK
jgi:hypothetical protein